MIRGNFCNAITIITLTLIITACAQTDKPVTPRPTVVAAVVFEVDNDQLDILTPSQCEPEFSSENGCIRAPRDARLLAKFVLSAKQDADSACKTNSPAHRYVLDGVQIRGKSSPEKPQDWDSAGKPLDQEVLDDFDVADPTTGWLNVETSSANGRDQLTFTDNNESESGYFIWYRLRAKCNDPMMSESDPKKYIYSDPRIDNLGKKRTY